ncbi:MAG: 30S ribosomal protein S16 [Flavobacteriales bacterium]|nr:MAG: 30S ribosomal protein S16 [Flavobacteriales bacterium]
MPTKIRLQRHGKKRYAYYHVVVADARAPRDGKFIEKLGTYNPNDNPATIDISFDRALHWVKEGAQPTDTVRALLSYKGVMHKDHLDRGVTKGALTQDQADKKFDTWMKEKEAKVDGKKDGLAKAADANAKARLAAETEVKNKKAAEVLAKQSELAAAVEAEAAEKAAAAAPAEEATTEEAPAETTTEEVAAEAPAKEEVKEEAAPEAKAEEPAAEVKKEAAAEETKKEAPVEAKAEEPVAEAKADESTEAEAKAE